MRAIQSSVVLSTYQQELVDVLQSQDFVIFLDTNMLAWAFRLNDDASREFQQWLDKLAELERLIIPAWTVHEYNHHLLRNDPNFFLPHKAVGKQLNNNLEQLDRVVHLMVSDESANELEYGNRDELITALTDASKVIQKCVNYLDKNSSQRKDCMINFFEKLILKCAIKNNVHDLADSVGQEAQARCINRLAPGYKDAQKTENSNGDLIIWREILDYCKSKNARKAILITNDCKSDWVYTPPFITLQNEKKISGTTPRGRLVKLPKPDLIAEFEHHTGSRHFHIFSIESIIEGLSTGELNYPDAQNFRHLASAFKLDRALTPTEIVEEWFKNNPEIYKEALRGVCYWEQSPSEVDMAAFEAWTVEKMKNVDAHNVQWMAVFCELFL